MTTSQLSIAVIGCGFIGKQHVDNLLLLQAKGGRVRLAAICDVDEKKTRALCLRVAGHSTHSSVRTTSVPEDIIEDHNVDAVVIATPPATHSSLARAAHAAGKHVFLEKPVAPTVSEALSLAESMERSGGRGKVQVNFKFRFSPAFQSAVRHLGRSLISSMHVGAPRIDDRHAMFDRKNGGYLLDCGVHAMDMLLHFHPRGLVRVQAEGRTVFHRRSDALDTVVATLRFEDDTLATFTLTDAAYNPWVSKWFYQGFRDGRAVSITENARKALLVHGPAESASPKLESVDLPNEDELLRSLKSFIDAVLDDHPPSPTLRDGVLASLLVEAIAESAHSRKPTTVDLSNHADQKRAL